MLANPSFKFISLTWSWGSLNPFSKELGRFLESWLNFFLLFKKVLGKVWNFLNFFSLGKFFILGFFQI